MGKKRVIQKTEEELIKERDKVEESIKKGASASRKRKYEGGRIYISSSYNNTLMSLADEQGNVVAWSSAGKLGFKGTKKGTPFAASKVAEFIIDAALSLKMERFEVYVKGIGAGRDASLRSIAARGLSVNKVTDKTPLAHNGPRPRKVRKP